MAEGAPLAPESTAPHVRHASAEATRTRSRSSNARTLEGGRDASLCRTQRGTGRSGRGDDRLIPCERLVVVPRFGGYFHFCLLCNARPRPHRICDAALTAIRTEVMTEAE